VADDITISREFLEVRRADSITVLVNGKDLLDVGLRHNAKQEVVMILQGLIDGQVTNPKQRIALVLSKIDLIRTADDAVRRRVESDFNETVEKVRRLFSTFFSEIHAFEVAAIPASTVVAHGYGLPEVLHFWIAPISQIAAPPVTLPRPKRAMGRFGLGVLGVLS